MLVVDFVVFKSYDQLDLAINQKYIMAKKRVAYFYDEDVGNFHYGNVLFVVTVPGMACLLCFELILLYISTCFEST